jgi:hypothetical protein
MYKGARKMRQTHDEIIASQIDFGRRQTPIPIVEKIKTPEKPKKAPGRKKQKIDFEMHCKSCGKVIPINGLPRNTYARRKFCSPECRVEGLRIKTPIKFDRYCKACGKLIPKDGLYESQYKNRKFCDTTCKYDFINGRNKPKQGVPWDLIEDILKLYGVEKIDIVKPIFELGQKYA